MVDVLRLLEEELSKVRVLLRQREAEIDLLERLRREVAWRLKTETSD